jgi:signal peptidase II
MVLMIKRLFFPALLIGILVGLDQWSKYLVETNLEYGVPVEVAPFFAFFRTYNDGVSFSMFSGFGVGGLIAMSSTVLAIVLWIWSKTEKDRTLAHLGFALITAGAIGNLIDRATLGVVIDFIQFHTDNWSFAIFNVADAYISVGVGAIVLDELLAWLKSRKTEEINREPHP